MWKKVIAGGIVDGLLSSSILLLFWAPFLTFIALPLQDAQIKEQICFFARMIPGGNLNIPAKILLEQQEESLPQTTSINTFVLCALWVFAVLWTCLSLVIVSFLIRNIGTTWRYLSYEMMFVAPVVLLFEIALFSGVVMVYNPYDMRKVAIDSFNYIASILN